MAVKVRKKKSGEINKSEAIRQYLATNKNANPLSVVDALAANGVEVSTGLVSQVKSVMRKKRKLAKLEKQNKNSLSVNMSDLIAAKTFIQKAGSFERAQSALNVLSKLKS
jgi:hypothetical protein